jgi:toxin ParE1/3/4
MNFRISREANLDLENIWLYTFENWSKEQADRYVNLLIDEIEYLAQNPLSGQNSEEIRKGYYRSQIKSHFIFYKINQKINKIEVVRISHKRMDVETRLKD